MTGVRAGRHICAGELVERCPVIVIPSDDVVTLARTDLAPYLELWPADDVALALPLGYGALYEESDAPNTTVARYPDIMCLDVIAAVDIAEGEQVTVPRRWGTSGWPLGGTCRRPIPFAPPVTRMC